ncbi:MAG: hypothetical protein LBU67_09485 [Oscillospiraceae bacterium]|jgi:hypothetical protein|nr:hypothetical protein [Oscillospiraceae bacterium]
MRFSTFRGLAAGSVIGLAVGAGMMMTPQARKVRRALDKGGAAIKKQMMDMWGSR